MIAGNFQNADLRGVRTSIRSTASRATFKARVSMAPRLQTCEVDRRELCRLHLPDRQRASCAQLLGGCLSCNFRGGSLSGQDLSGVPLIGVDFSAADLRRANFTGAMLCWYGGNGTTRKPICDDMHDAQTTGAKFVERPALRQSARRAIAACSAVPMKHAAQYMGPKLGLTGP